MLHSAMIISNIARPVELNIKYRYAVQNILNSKKYKQTVSDLMLFLSYTNANIINGTPKCKLQYKLGAY